MLYTIFNTNREYLESLEPNMLMHEILVNHLVRIASYLVMIGCRLVV